MGDKPEKESPGEQFENASSDILGIGDGDSSDGDVLSEEMEGESSSNTSSTGTTGEDGSADSSDQSGKTLKEERTQVPMMLTEEEEQQLEVLWTKIKAEATAEGLDLEKHRDFWTAVVPVITANEDAILENLGL